MEYQIMFYGGMAGAALALVLSVFLYIKLNIPQVVKDLTGFTLPGASRIANRLQHAQAEQTGRITNEIKLRKHVEVESAAGPSRHAQGSGAPTALLSPNGSGTKILTGNPTETTMLMGKQNKKAVSSRAGVETTLLSEAKPSAARYTSTPPLNKTTLLAQKGVLDETALLNETRQEDTALPTQHPGPEAKTLLKETQIPDQEETALLMQYPGKEAATLLKETLQTGREETVLLAQHPGKGASTLLKGTTQLGQEKTQPPGQNAAKLPALEETTILSELEETTVLSEIEGTARQAAAAAEPEHEPAFKKEVDIMIVHSSTTI